MTYKRIFCDGSQTSTPSNPRFSINQQAAGYRIETVAFPRNYSNITSTENTFYLVEADSATNRRLINCPTGSYNSGFFCAALNDALSAAGTQQYFVEIADASRCLFFTTNGNKQFQIVAGTSAKGIGTGRGYSSPVGNSVLLPHELDLSNAKVFLLCSNSFGSESTRFLSDKVSLNVVAAIPSSSGDGDFISWTAGVSDFLECDALTSLEFSIIDSQKMQSLEGFEGPLLVTLGILSDDADKNLFMS